MRTPQEIESLRDASSFLQAAIGSLRGARGTRRIVAAVKRAEQAVSRDINNSLVESADRVLAEDGGKYL